MAWAAVTTAGLALALLSLRLGLNGDVQYVLGGLQVAPDGFAGTFVHRPLAYRTAMAALDALARLVASPVSDLARYEAAMRVLGILAGVSAGALLWRALETRLHAAQAATIGLAVGLALALSPAWDFLQPEWLATMFAVLAVAAAIGLKGRLPAALLAGTCLVVVIGMKLATAPLAVASLLFIWWLDRRQAADAAWAALVITVIAVLATAAFMPLEWQWIRDMAALNPNGVGRSGFDLRDLELTARTVGSKLALQPLLVLVPAAVVLLARQRPKATRWRFVVCTALAIGMAVAPAALQGQYYLYHLAALPVLGAGLVAAALSAAPLRADSLAYVGVTILVIACIVVLGAAPAWRTGFGLSVTIGLAAIGAVAAVLAALLPIPASIAGPVAAPGWVRVPALTALLTLATAPALVPGSAWSLNPSAVPWTNSSWQARSVTEHAQLSAMREEIGANALVLYLAPGDVIYHLANPTDCRYPSPLFVQRGPALPYVTAFSSYADNLACLSSSSAAYAIIQPEWFGLDGLLPDVRAPIAQRWDCSAPLIAGDAIACPRRMAAKP